MNLIVVVLGILLVVVFFINKGQKDKAKRS
jgi:hypothetical protein